MVTFELAGGRETVNRFMQALRTIPFAPTLGDVSTMISHPAVTSHRGLTAAARDALGIREGTIRVSVGVEAFSLLEDEFHAALSEVSASSGASIGG
jgi:cystathionine gamma-synthase